jgi:hypothetical protein
MENTASFNINNFNKHFVKGTEEECWNWLGTGSTYGYFSVKINGKWRDRGAHRIALYIKLNYDIKFLFSNLHAGHTCGNKKCVNPNHLEPQTSVENIDERDKRLGNSCHAKGEKNHSKLTNEQVIEIRNSVGNTHQKLADKYNIATSAITNIINRKSWKHI